MTWTIFKCSLAVVFICCLRHRSSIMLPKRSGEWAVICWINEKCKCVVILSVVESVCLPPSRTHAHVGKLTRGGGGRGVGGRDGWWHSDSLKRGSSKMHTFRKVWSVRRRKSNCTSRSREGTCRMAVCLPVWATMHQSTIMQWHKNLHKIKVWQ